MGAPIMTTILHTVCVHRAANLSRRRRESNTRDAFAISHSFPSWHISALSRLQSGPGFRRVCGAPLPDNVPGWLAG